MKELERGGPFVLVMQHIMYSFWIIRILKKIPIVTFQFLDKLQSLQLLFQITVHL